MPGTARRVMLQTIPSNCVTLHPLCGTASKQNENLYAAFAKFKFSLWAKQTIQTIKWCETSFLQCAEWDFLIFLSRESIFCNIALRSLCLTWSDLHTPRGSGLRVRTSQSLRNTRASSWTSTPWRKMMNAEFCRKTLCQVNASKVSYKYNVSSFPLTRLSKKIKGLFLVLFFWLNVVQWFVFA